MKKDRYGYVEFIDMQSVPVLFNERPSFSELIAGAREEIHCHRDVDGIDVDGVINLGAAPNILRRIIRIDSENQWDNYVRLAMKSQLQCLDVVVRPVFIDPTPHDYAPVTDELATNAEGRQWLT